MIPLCRPALDSEEQSAVIEALQSGWLAHGPKVEELEEKFAGYLCVKYAVSLNSCTSALYLALVASDIRGEVIVPSFTFVASANAIVTAGCKPVFVDIDYKTHNLDVTKIEAKLSPKTRAIMPVHFAGQSCEMAAIVKLARKHRLTIIEDSAQSVGATYKGRKTGSFGIGCFSFFPTKNMTTGEGGMLTTSSARLAKRVRALAGHGIASTSRSREKKTKPWVRAAAFAGFNFRMSNILAAIGVEQLAKVDELNRARQKRAAYLTEKLKEIDEIELPYESADATHVF